MKKRFPDEQIEAEAGITAPECVSPVLAVKMNRHAKHRLVWCTVKKFRA